MARLGHAQLLLGDEQTAYELGQEHGNSDREWSGGDVPKAVRKFYSQGFSRGRIHKAVALAEQRRHEQRYSAAA